MKLLVVLVLAMAGLAAAAPRRPNFILILTDDQDALMGSLDYQPAVERHFRRAGTWFRKHFCTVAMCCPSRVSLLTGRAAHNTNVTDVKAPYGGYSKFVAEGLNDRYLPIWLQEAGYNTYYAGKLLNGLSTKTYKKWPVRGWKRSSFLIDPGMYNYYNSCMTVDNGQARFYAGQYSTDVIANHSVEFLHDAMRQDEPFFMVVAPASPHAEMVPGRKENVFDVPVPAKRHEHLFPGARVPRTPDFNQVTTQNNSVGYFSLLPPLTPPQINYTDTFYRRRVQALQSVDDLISSILNPLAARPDVLDNTFLIYTSDNGYHMGQHRLPPGKTSNVEQDINVPFFVRGPGVPAGRVVDSPTSHTDIVPSVFRYAGLDALDEFDGEAMPWTGGWKREEHVNVEFWGGRLVEGTVFEPPEVAGDARKNTYKSLRVIGPDYDFSYTVWCTNEHELYNMKLDPYQLNNVYHSALTGSFSTLRLLSRLDTLLLTLKSCTALTCRRPWQVLFSHGGVASLADAMHPRYDIFFEAGQVRVSFSGCLDGYLVKAEGAQGAVPFTPFKIGELMLRGDTGQFR